MISTIDYSMLYNPYDFANPVLKKDLFSGREAELKEIRYYLDQAKKAPRPTNLALLGARASGKTSLLNMIELDAKERGMCVARIDLNESDTKTELSFFFKLFDGIFSAACNFKKLDDPQSETCAFGGKQGKTYETYLGMISAFEIPDDKIWRPFVFPLQYAMAMRRGMLDAKVSDQSFRGDLDRISSEVGVPIAILFDECNVLSNKRELLQMIRNVFMNTPGFMLVFTGTPDLFPIMDEVFSPIVRQFKKIDVVSYEKPKETADCIRKPLESLGLKSPWEIFEGETVRELNSIHSLTGGRPYEIQLLCHFMFKRLQQGLARKMRLSIEVLDDVLRELRQGHNIATRPIITAIRSLDEKSLSALNLLATCSGHASFDQVWFIEYSLRGEERWKREELLSYLVTFEEQGIIKRQGELILFQGDDFDRIYSKYYAQQRKIKLSFPDYSTEQFLAGRLNNFCQKTIGLKPIAGIRALASGVVFRQGFNSSDNAGESLFFVEGEELSNIRNTVEALRTGTRLEEIYKNLSFMVEALYWLMLECEENKASSFTLVNIFAVGSNIVGDFTYYFAPKDNFEWLPEFSAKLSSIQDRAKSLGGDFKVTVCEVQSCSGDLLVKNISCCNDDSLKNSLALTHEIQAISSYLGRKEVLHSLHHAELVCAYNTKLGRDSANNMGYIHLAAGKYEKAKELFESAITESRGYSSLPYYNLAMAELKLGNKSETLKLLEFILQEDSKGTYEKETAQCLFIPVEGNSSFELEEIYNPVIAETARDATARIIAGQ